jgi:hypothetical protein
MSGRTLVVLIGGAALCAALIAGAKTARLFTSTDCQED